MATNSLVDACGLWHHGPMAQTAATDTTDRRRRILDIATREFAAKGPLDRLAHWCAETALRDSGLWGMHRDRRVGLVLGLGAAACVAGAVVGYWPAHR